VERFQNRRDVSDVRESRGFNSSTSRILNKLRFWKIEINRVTVIKFRLNNGTGDGIGSFKN